VRHPHIVVWERDGRLARQLDALAAERRWALRESRQAEPCFRLLASSGPCVFVVRLVRAADAGPALMARVRRQLWDVPIVAVGEAEESGSLANLAWDLGADFALFPPLPLTLLPEVVSGLMPTPLGAPP
jgi:hypothetical protein